MSRNKYMLNWLEELLSKHGLEGDSYMAYLRRLCTAYGTRLQHTTRHAIVVTKMKRFA